MNTLVIGSGGREHALVRVLNKSKQVTNVFALPGNDGMTEATCIDDIHPDEHDKIGEFCKKNNIEWVVVGPEAPLSKGLVNDLEDQYDLKVFGPRKFEAQMESSKSFTKNLMKRYDIPTANFETFTDKDKAKEYLENSEFPIVLKKDGLAAGKGVVIANTLEESLTALEHLMTDQEEIVIEEFLKGEEFSLMVLVNGDTFKPFNMVAQDYKRAYDGDKGPNTGGMGAYAPVDYLEQSKIDEAVEKIVKPTVDAMVKEGLNYFGVLYLGAIVTKDGVKTIEYNARFGDPEAQILLDLLETDFIDVLENMYNKTDFKLSFRDEYAVGVILASKGYPGSYTNEKEITIDDNTLKDVYVSALKQIDSNKYLSSGGRVLLVIGRGDTIEAAKKEAYNIMNKIEFNKEELFFRADIAHRA